MVCARRASELQICPAFWSVLAGARHGEGFAVCGYCRFSDEQRGVSIGLFNQTEYLNGVQVGLLNYAGNNPGWARWLPLVNVHID